MFFYVFPNRVFVHTYKWENQDSERVTSFRTHSWCMNGRTWDKNPGSCSLPCYTTPLYYQHEISNFWNLSTTNIKILTSEKLKKKKTTFHFFETIKVMLFFFLNTWALFCISLLRNETNTAYFLEKIPSRAETASSTLNSPTVLSSAGHTGVS